MTEVILMFVPNLKFAYKYLCESTDDLTMQILNSEEFMNNSQAEVLIIDVIMPKNNDNYIFNKVHIVNSIVQQKLKRYKKENSAIKITNKAFSYNELLSVTRNPDDFFMKSYHDEEFEDEVICKYKTICKEENRNCRDCAANNSRYTNLVTKR
jgi:hypothetical protein